MDPKEVHGEDFPGETFRVNGQIASLGQKADPAVDKITVDEKAIAAARFNL